jgi:hypothetical protein
LDIETVLKLETITVLEQSYLAQNSSPQLNTHMYIWTFPEGKTEYIFIASTVLCVRSDCDTDSLLWLWRQSLSEQELQKFNVERFGLEELHIVKAIRTASV